MPHAHADAEDLYRQLRQLPAAERRRFFLILSEGLDRQVPDATHEAVFGHLVDAQLTSTQAAQYLEVSTSTLRRLMKAGRLRPCSTVGRNQLFAAAELRSLKQAMRAFKG
jgi:excisionase family DNA binding protein